MDVEKDILSKYYSIFDGLPRKGEGELRFGLSLVRISDIASQYYCEKKIELQQEHPLPPSEKMIKGEAGHESVTELEGGDVDSHPGQLQALLLESI